MGSLLVGPANLFWMLIMGQRRVTKDRRIATRIALEATALLSGAAILIPVAWTTAAFIQRCSRVPELVNVDSRLGRYFLSPSEAKLVRTKSHGLLVQPEPGDWPGVLLEDVWPDWRGYTALAIDVTNPGLQPTRLFVRIDDRRWDPGYPDRYNGQFQLAPQTRRVLRIPLSEIRTAPKSQAMDLAHIQQIVLFEDGSAPTHAFYLNALRLE